EIDGRAVEREPRRDAGEELDGLVLPRRQHRLRLARERERRLRVFRAIEDRPGDRGEPARRSAFERAVVLARERRSREGAVDAQPLGGRHASPDPGRPASWAGYAPAATPNTSGSVGASVGCASFGAASASPCASGRPASYAGYATAATPSASGRPASYAGYATPRTGRSLPESAGAGAPGVAARR